MHQSIDVPVSDKLSILILRCTYEQNIDISHSVGNIVFSLTRRYTSSEEILLMPSALHVYVCIVRVNANPEK